ncbi:MAG: glycosyl transferase [Planctomycetes bacterium]|nr:glycosyl transferase [Planctomycetota bacterium]
MLTIGELWAVPITLRIVLLENLRRSSDGIIQRRTARQRADELADGFLRDAVDPDGLASDLGGAPIAMAYAVQILHRLRDHDPLATPGLRWLDRRLAERSMTAEEVVHEEHRRQVSMNLTVRNVIASMRLSAEVDWVEFFESVSGVDARLREHSAFGTFDLATRDRYRHAIEELARRSARTELEVAELALQAANRARSESAQDSAHDLPSDDQASRARRSELGYYLIAKGRERFEIEMGYRVPLRARLLRLRRAMGIFGYLGCVLLLTGLCLGALLFATAGSGVSAMLLLGIALLGLLPASEIAVAWANRRVAKHHGPQLLPGLELRDGVPAELRTLVVVPSMLTSLPQVDEQLERLEVHYLACPQDDLQFALLSDWSDAEAEHAAEDDALLAAAAEGIARLNRQHGPAPGGDRFLLLHRRRIWSAVEGHWMGWERKRGKLHELNRWLRGAEDTTIVAIAGRAVPLVSTVRFVLTLDADTRLPRGAARRLVGKMAHPLNRPSLDRWSGRVVEGYAILQPRITPALPEAGAGSWYQRSFSGPCGIDPYAFAVSDVYQDLLGEGSYTGKGIYDVDAFEGAMALRVPESTVLSHDLLEGIFARAGLASDVELVEEFPNRYDVAAARSHRWARGDWQLLPWVLGRGRDASGEPGRRTISLIGRWKMLDNLRRSAMAPACYAALTLGWANGDRAALATSGLVVGAIALPCLLSVWASLRSRALGCGVRRLLLDGGADLGSALLQILFGIAVLAHQAWLMADAIVRTLFRLFIRRRHMLEWLTAARAASRRELGWLGSYRHMAGGIGLASAALLVLAASDDPAWSVALPFLALWMFAPILTEQASRRPGEPGTSALDAAEAQGLREIARRTWTYFERHVSAADHMLPPDNLQVDPEPVLAHRTSPTNIGLYLLTVVSARDFGWIGTEEALERIEATWATLGRMECHRGHLYNWYDTRDLRPLEPRYVSSVDSGNLAAHLIVLRAACRGFRGDAISKSARHAGLRDALRLLQAALHAIEIEAPFDEPARFELRERLKSIASTLEVPVETAAASIAAWDAIVERVDALASTIGTLTARQTNGASAAMHEVETWVAALVGCAHSHRRDLELLRPWVRAREIASQGDGSQADSPGSAARGALVSVDELPELLASAGRALGVASDRDAELRAALEGAGRAAGSLVRRLTRLEAAIAERVEAMDFRFLFDPLRQLFSIGYRVAESQLDRSFYDLLASEARVASFVAIAKGDATAKHWFLLGRRQALLREGAVLASWSGSMFEYLMPGLVMRAPIGSLLERTCRLVVRRQIAFGAETGTPWGISESAYHVRNLELTYQYSSFGVPGLGLKRGLAEDLVIAPYATALAAMIDPLASVQNFAHLAAEGAYGRHGYYEALDYTPSRRPPEASVAIVRAYMAHHQGMTIVALGNVLHGGAMRTRFHSDPAVMATELLLQERVPRGAAPERLPDEGIEPDAMPRDVLPPALRRFHSPHHPIPRTHLLSNGSYAVMLSSAGSGYSRRAELAVTRWQEDVTCDEWGSFFYVRDRAGGATWSAGFQPTCAEPNEYEVAFSEERAEISRRDGSIVTKLEVLVSAEDDAEVRRISLHNLGTRVRELEVTSYAELVLGAADADAAHPAFSKLFVQTEYVEASAALLATRRKRKPEEPTTWAAHIAVIEGEVLGAPEHETDRARFIGRGRSLRAPLAMMPERSLSNTTGAVLDAVFSLRHRLRIPPGAVARIAFWTVVAPSRTEVLNLVQQHRHPGAFERTSTLAWTQAQVQLQHRGIGTVEAHLFQRLANRVLYSDPSLRPASDTMKRSTAGPRALWAHGISGDLPIVLVCIDDVEDLEIVRQLLRAHSYWRQKQLDVDLVILNERIPSYAQDLQTSLDMALRAHPPLANGGGGRRKRGAVFTLHEDVLTQEALLALQSVARAVVFGRRGSLAEQVRRMPVSPALPSARKYAEPVRGESAERAPSTPSAEFSNGWGGFVDEGREYRTTLERGAVTPAPWINVVCNARFGFQVSAEGGGYTWSQNSRENQITSWSNDAVLDPLGECFYVRDLESGALWCPTALPIRDPALRYVAWHGQGYSRFEHVAHGIALELTQYVPLEDSIKIARLRIRNLSSSRRQLAVTAYVEWVLGRSRGASAPHVVTEVDPTTHAILARNSWRVEFGERIAFADLGGRQTSWTCDRTEFLGRNGTAARPASLAIGGALARRSGAGLDPCAALQTEIWLAPFSTTEVVLFVGEAEHRAAALSLISRYRAADLDAVLQAVRTHWSRLLETVQVRTPDRSIDLLLNRWLLYQTLACRSWARAGFYQASGAYGFRDQLQDAMALVLAYPSLTRGHLLRAASRQFVEGDVQHWWLPNSGAGVRTRHVDDGVWLPYATAHYLHTTGDAALLDEAIPFLEGPHLREGVHEDFFTPSIGAERASLFEHCARALDASLSVGANGLPLFGSGDWNDGMNRVGIEGRGESTWMAWFLCATLQSFAPLAEERGELDRAERWRAHREALRAALDRVAWDGAWYRRGSYDDGSLLGSATSTECQIDSIAQSWAVISAAGDPERARLAMASLHERLILPAEQLALLFTPPFDDGPQDPGYIRGYPPGIRENGGQYTHAALWAVIAFAELGDGEKAMEVFGMANPIRRSSTMDRAERYRVEPYVACADIYSVAPHVGRGGWTWYTGSAGWMYRAALEWILGFRLSAATLRIDPCIPAAWPGFEIAFRWHATLYRISVENPDRISKGVARLLLDGVERPSSPAIVTLVDDGGIHRIQVVMGLPPSASSTGSVSTPTVAGADAPGVA